MATFKTLKARPILQVLAIEFFPLAIEFATLALELVRNKIGSWRKHENKM